MENVNSSCIGDLEPYASRISETEIKSSVDRKFRVKDSLATDKTLRRVGEVRVERVSLCRGPVEEELSADSPVVGHTGGLPHKPFHRVLGRVRTVRQSDANIAILTCSEGERRTKNFGKRFTFSRATTSRVLVLAFRDGTVDPHGNFVELRQRDVLFTGGRSNLVDDFTDSP